jgi:hypothetical protein
MQTMEASISNELLESEELLWSGRPVTGGKSITSPARLFSILGLIYGGLGLLFMLVMLLIGLFVGGLNDAWPMLIPGSIFFILGLMFFIIGQVYRSSPRTTFYAITNRRIIILQGGRYLKAISYDIKAIHQVQRLERPDGSGDLVFSGMPGVHSVTMNNNNMANRLTFFSAIPEVRLAERKLLAVMGKV